MAWLKSENHLHYATELHDNFGLVRYDAPVMELRRVRGVEDGTLRELADVLTRGTGVRWSISASDAQAQPSLWDQEKQAEAAHEAAVKANPSVQRIMSAFPDARLVGVEQS